MTLQTWLSEDEEEPNEPNEELRNDDETGSYDEWGFWIPKEPKEVRDEEEPKSGGEEFRNDDETGIPKEVRDEEEPKSGGEEFRNADETGSYDASIVHYDEWGFYIPKKLTKELRDLTDEEEPKSPECLEWKELREHGDDGSNVAEAEGSNISADEGSKISAKECLYYYIDADGVSDERFAEEIYRQTLREERIKEMVRRGELEDRYGMWASSEEETEQQNQREVKTVKTEQQNEAEARTEQQTEREKETAKRKRMKLPEPLKKRALQGQRNGPKQLDSQIPTVPALCDGELWTLNFESWRKIPQYAQRLVSSSQSVKVGPKLATFFYIGIPSKLANNSKMR